MCTGIRLVAEDGAPVFGRTMEFGADLISFNLMVVPRGTAFTGTTPNGQDGMQWTAAHGFVAAIPFDIPGAMEGVNEAGLQAGAFFFQPFARARFQDADPKARDRTLSNWELLTYLLSRAASVAEARKLLAEVLVVSTAPYPAHPGWDFQPSVHFALNDETGAAIVVEYLDGQLQVFDNPLGVITNPPDFPWHQENLRQFTSLPVDKVPPFPRAAGETGASGLDIGKKANLPGEITSPNRFVRAAVYSQNALPFANGTEGVQRVLNILNNFDIPLGYKQYQHVDGRVFPQYTQWTSVTDIRSRKLYFRTFGNPNLQVIGLHDLDLSKGKVRRIPVSNDFSALSVI
jgi:choloylglycine hydrolase